MKLKKVIKLLKKELSNLDFDNNSQYPLMKAYKEAIEELKFLNVLKDMHSKQYLSKDEIGQAVINHFTKIKK